MIIIVVCIPFVHCQEKISKEKFFHLPGFLFENFEETPYHDLALYVKDNDTISIRKEILEKKLNIDYQDPKHKISLLSLAILHKRKDSFLQLLKLGANPNLLSGDENELTPFLLALIFNDNCETFYIENLLAHNANINQVIKYKSNNILKYKIPLFAITSLNNDDGSVCMNILDLFYKNDVDLNVSYFDEMFMFERTIISECLLSKNIIFLEDLIINKKVKIPEVVDVHGMPGSYTKYSLVEVLNNEEFDFSDDYEYNKAKENILNYLMRNE